MFSIFLHIHCGFRLEFKASHLYSFGCAFRIVIKHTEKSLGFKYKIHILYCNQHLSFIASYTMSLIRPATLADVIPILQVKTKAWKEGYQGILDQTYLNALDITPKRIKKFQNWIEKCEIFLVYEEGSTLIGFICGGLAQEEEEAPYPYEISAFYVDPAYQRKGIGTQLFDAFKQRIGTAQYFLWTLAGSKGEKFYRKH
jgi:GNAT superfamily N-acetyltransferase